MKLIKLKSPFSESPFLSMSEHSSRCSYWSWHLRSGGDTGCAGQRLLLLPVPLLTAPSAGARPLVLSTHVPFPLLFLLQELCLHHGALLVRVFLWLLCTGIGYEDSCLEFRILTLVTLVFTFNFLTLEGIAWKCLHI